MIVIAPLIVDQIILSKKEVTFMYTCYECGKQIEGQQMIVTNPPIYLIKLGLDFVKTMHKKCYEKAEIKAEKEL